MDKAHLLELLECLEGLLMRTWLLQELLLKLLQNFEMMVDMHIKFMPYRTSKITHFPSKERQIMFKLSK